MARGKSVRKTSPSRINLPRDNTKIKIAIYLMNKNQGDRRYGIMKYAGLRKQEPAEFKKCILEMCEEGWIKETKFDIGGGMEVYEITVEGKDAVEKAKELVRANHPLTKLHAFRDIDIP